MARKEITQYFDDLDGAPLNDDQVHIVRFSLEGTNYVLDLSAENATKLHEALQPFIDVARKETATTRRATAPRRNNRAKEIRKWAQDNGYDVADRGKIPTEVIDAYDAAHK
ncbi:histone-like nucleoid-structuring protein Lsr2 [Corynebacterium renale]|uniref:Lsr2 protein n=1 Tax=Corynebacterium renale TaxID=1724 RepID=A0A2A9DP53_9CORY|nr:Lsr2 family protein [Corynebacterium renale]PFG27762.1 Lsr2 protein [Corynebacterium renale]SQI22125.1 multifunctional histone-like protein [Corynebacterium renale]